MMQRLCLGVSIVLMGTLSGCGNPEGTSPLGHADAPPPAFKISASIQDLMQHEIDLSADALWNSVSTDVTEKGVVEHQPRTDEEWFAARSHAITLMEASNLLIMDGRKVLLPGQTMADEGVQGVLPATEVQAKIAANREQFIGFAHLLHDVGERMLKAIDQRNVKDMLDVGEQMDTVCESCHMTFWYPNQKIPEFPN